MSRDPEVAALTAAVSDVVKRAFALSRTLDLTVRDLQTFDHRYETLAPRRAWRGEERRKHARES